MHLDLPALIDTYGYFAVAIGAFLEGETVLALAGLAAHRGYLDLPLVIIVAAIAGFAGDQLYFYLGRHQGARILARYPDARHRADKFDAMLARWHAPLIIGIRFMYGFRIVGPVLLGMGRVSHTTFALYNALGALLWAPLIAGLGFLFGEAIETVLHDVKDVEIWGLGVLALVGAGVFAFHKIHERRLRGQTPNITQGTDP
jgi:membrane protein DedA with SNARE-associated domain